MPKGIRILLFAPNSTYMQILAFKRSQAFLILLISRFYFSTANIELCLITK